MSNETRENPAVPDEEPIGAPAEAPAIAETPAPPSGEIAAEMPPAADGTDAPVKKKKKKPASGSAPGKSRSGAKKADKAAADEPKKKKKAAADEPKKKKKSAEKKPAEPEAEPKAPADETGSGEDGAKRAPNAKKDAPKPGQGHRAARGVLIGLIVVVCLLLALCAGVMVCAKLVTESDTTLPNVMLGEIPVGGLTQEQTLQALEEAKWDETRGGTLTVSLPEDVSFELDFLTAGACEPKEEAAEAAFRYGHGEDRFENLLTYVNAMLAPKDLSRTEFTIDRAYVMAAVNEAVDEFERRTDGGGYSVNEESATLEMVKGAGEVSLDREAICDRACAALLAGEREMSWETIIGEPVMPDFTAIAAELDREAVDACYDPEKDEVVLEILGVKLNADEARSHWEKAGVLETVSVPISIVQPKLTAEELSELLFRDKLGEKTTYLWGSTANRISNVRLACSRFNELVLLPGESFSYNDVVGERTADAGFKLAPTYSGTAHIDGLGGGICQVSSTLYNAVQYANLQVDERVCHTMLVGYLAPGLDATVDWPDTNFAFTNNRDYPIRIKAGVDDAGHALTIEIWGTDVDGSWVEIFNAEWPAYDDTYQERYGLNVQVGVGAWNFRRVHNADGSYTDMEKVYSYYHIPEDEIKWPVVEIDEEDSGESADSGED